MDEGEIQLGGSGEDELVEDQGVVWSIPTNQLTTVEQRLVDAVTTGNLLILGPEVSATEGTGPAWGPERQIRAMVVRDLLRSKHATDPDPQGIRLVGARITGRLHINDLHTTIPLNLIGCYLDHGINAANAHLRQLVLAQTVIIESDFPALFADGLTVDGQMSLAGGVFASANAAGAIKLVGAHICGPLRLTGARITNDKGPAILADALTIDGAFNTNGADLHSNSPMAAIRLLGARVRGQLSIQDTKVTNANGPSLDAEALAVDTAILLTGSTFIGEGRLGAVRLLEARIEGQFNLHSVLARNSSGPALIADGLIVKALFILSNGVFSGNSEMGAVSLLTAQVGSKLNLQNASLSNGSGPALIADGLTVSASTTLARSKLKGGGSLGSLRLSGAAIEGQLDLVETHLSNDDGPALHCDGLTVKDVMTLSGGTFIARSALGAIRLRGAQVGGRLHLDVKEATNPDGPALLADRVRAGSHVSFDGGSFVGSGDRGTIRLPGAKFGGTLNLRVNRANNDRGPALDAERIIVDSHVNLDGGSFGGSGERGTIRLPGAQIGGQLNLNVKSATNPDGIALFAEGITVSGDTFLDDARFAGTQEYGCGGVRLADASLRRLSVSTLVLSAAHIEGSKWDVDGLTYTGTPSGVNHQEWLLFLQNGTTRYAAQPYQHTAAAQQASGHHKQVRDILIAQRKDQLARTNPRWRERAWAWVTWLTLGFGYKPERALGFLLGLLTIAILSCLIWPGPVGLEEPATGTTPAANCTWTSQVDYALTTTIPLIATKTTCATKSNTAGTALKVGGWGFSFATWALLTLFIAGFTTAVRKT